MDALPEWVKLLGGAAGIAALIWRVVDEFGAYLRISVKVETPKGGWASAQTTVENKGNRAKNLSYAFLLIGPEEESPIESAKVLAVPLDYKGPLEFTDQFVLLHASAPTYAEGRALIPLPFYYSENVDIADETLSYRAPVDARMLRDGIPYAVRFFVFGKRRLHRSTHDSFINTHA
jgi:hypothetical protein